MTRRTVISHAKIMSRLRKKTRAVLIDAGERTLATTTKGILEGAILGPGHIASKPGEYPNADTGELHQSYRSVDLSTSDEIDVAVFSPLAKARKLEIGDSQVEPRPHLGPSFHKELPMTRSNLRKVAKG